MSGDAATATQPNATFLQFAFKYLLYFEERNEKEEDKEDVMRLTQVRTLRLLDEHSDELLLINFAAANDLATVDALVLVLLWCLTSRSKKVRAQATSLLEKVKSHSDQANAKEVSGRDEPVFYG